MTDRIPQRMWGWGLALAVFGANLFWMAPTITAGDAAELSAAQSTLGIAHSLGYPFFVVAGKAASALNPFGNPAYRTNIFSVLCSAAAAWLVFEIVLSWSASVLMSLSAGFFLMLVPCVREQMISTEVFGLNLVLLLSLILLAVRGTVPSFYLCGFLMGIGMGNQHTLILSVPALLIFFFGSLHAKKVSSGDMIRSAAFCGLFFLVGFSIYAFLPVRSFREPLLDWEDPQTWERFRAVLGRARYGMFQLAQGESADWSIVRFAFKTAEFSREVLAQIGAPLSAMMLAGGAISLTRKSTRLAGAALLALLIFSGPFFFMLSNVSAAGAGRDILVRFLPMPVTAFLLMGFLGVSGLRMKSWVGGAVGFAAVFLPPTESLRDFYALHDYGRDVLRTVPASAVLFADRADEIEFAACYLKSAEGRRKDVDFIDCNAGVTRSIYGTDYYRIWGKPRLLIREEKEKNIIGEDPSPVYYATVEPDMLPIPKVQRGLLYEAVKTGKMPLSAFDWDEIYSLRLDLNHPGFRGRALFSTYPMLLGRYYLGVSDPERARTFFKMLALLEPSGVWNHTAALWCMGKGQDGLAEEFFFAALKRGPEKDKVCSNLGVLYERTGKNGLAGEYYKKAVAYNPDSPQAHYNLAVFHWKNSLWKDAADEFETVLKLAPGHPEAGRFLAIARRKPLGSARGTERSRSVSE